MGMKEAFETFFEEMTNNYINERGKPSYAYCDGILQYFRNVSIC